MSPFSESGFVAKQGNYIGGGGSPGGVRASETSSTVATVAITGHSSPCRAVSIDIARYGQQLHL